MLYLAQVIRRNFPKRGTALKLLAMQQSNQLWIRADSLSIEVGAEAAQYTDRDLILVQLSPDRKPLSFVDAALALPQALCELSQRVQINEQKIQSQASEWELQRKSLEFQSQAIAKRIDEFDAREEFLKLQELQATQMIASVKSWAAKLKKERAALEGAWEHLRLEQQRLKESQGS